ncbi:MAG: hypothetical protein LPK80_10160 [Bacteroidota bacterium]|nr:hypothetical protein [Bacteroidota bacterium]MDX5427286.1 hypothetical protein [Bacteroidota bacterium]MDX5505238.1 hypothetical protein [Bacteroidota bacterium]
MIKKILFICALLSGFWSVAQVEWEASVDTNAIRIGEQLTLTLRAGSLEEGTVIWPQFGDTLGDLEVVQVEDTDTIDRNSMVQHLRLTSFDTGFAIIAPIQLVMKGDTQFTSPLLIRVNDVPVDDDQELYDIKAPIEAPFNWLKWSLIILGSGLILFMIFWIYRRITRKEETGPIRIVNRREPWEEFLERLRQREEKRSWDGNVKEHYSEISEVLRDYLERPFGVDALEVPTSEIQVNVRSLPWMSEDRNTLIDLLSRADLVKFAKSNPGPEVARDDLLQAIRLIERTHPRKEVDHE